jgi:hypothetical protein
MTDTPGGALLDSLGEIVRDYEALAPSRINVVPVLYRGAGSGLANAPFSAAVGVMGSVAHFLGGTLVDTGSTQFESAITTDRDAVLEGALPTVVAGMLGPATELRIDYAAGAVEARLFRRGREVTPSGGELRFLAVVRALFSPQLRTTQFAVLTYSEADLDRRLSPACFACSVLFRRKLERSPSCAASSLQSKLSERILASIVRPA